MHVARHFFPLFPLFPLFQRKEKEEEAKENETPAVNGEANDGTEVNNPKTQVTHSTFSKKCSHSKLL